jgi:kynurenine/2-aminoadipate aminotransferase
MFCGFCDKYLTGKATWTVPSAGMFVWFRVPKVKDTSDIIKNKAIEKKVLLVPGGVWWGGKTRYSRKCACIFSVALASLSALWAGRELLPQ